MNVQAVIDTEYTHIHVTSLPVPTIVLNAVNIGVVFILLFSNSSGNKMECVDVEQVSIHFFLRISIEEREKKELKNVICLLSSDEAQFLILI